MVACVSQWCTGTHMCTRTHTHMCTRTHTFTSRHNVCTLSVYKQAHPFFLSLTHLLSLSLSLSHSLTLSVSLSHSLCQRSSPPDTSELKRRQCNATSSGT